MGTLIEVQLACPEAEICARGFARAAEILLDIDRKMSLYHESELTRVNAAAGSAEAMQIVSADTHAVIEAALMVAGRSGGYFDPTIAPLVDLFHIYKAEAGTEVPEPGANALASARGLVNYRNVVISGARVGLRRQGMKLDLGGIAKGYALDRIADGLRAIGLRQFALNFGGHLLTSDIALETTVHEPVTGRPWLHCILRQGSLSVSAQQERFVRLGARRVGHIFNPISEKPGEPNQVTAVYHASAMLADAWSTALFFVDDRRFDSWARQNQLRAYRLSAAQQTTISEPANAEPVCRRVAPR